MKPSHNSSVKQGHLNPCHDIETRGQVQIPYIADHEMCGDTLSGSFFPRYVHKSFGNVHAGNIVSVLSPADGMGTDATTNVKDSERRTVAKKTQHRLGLCDLRFTIMQPPSNISAVEIRLTISVH